MQNKLDKNLKSINVFQLQQNNLLLFKAASLKIKSRNNQISVNIK